VKKYTQESLSHGVGVYLACRYVPHLPRSPHLFDCL
jgi:hypothetical protein